LCIRTDETIKKGDFQRWGTIPVQGNILCNGDYFPVELMTKGDTNIYLIDQNSALWDLLIDIGVLAGT